MILQRLQGRGEFGTLPRVSSNELIDQLFVHIMSEKKNDGGYDDLFSPSPKLRKVSTTTEGNRFGVSMLKQKI